MQVFTCRQCGQCCQGSGGIVLSARDLDRLAAHFNIDVDAVTEQFALKSNSRHKIRQSPDGFCIFFKQGQGCLIHSVKPDVCRAWPYFRGNLEDGISFEMAREYCIGIDKACSHEDFIKQGIIYLNEENLVYDASEATPNALINSHICK